MAKPKVYRPPFTRQRSYGAPAPASLSWENCSNGTKTSGTLNFPNVRARGEVGYMQDVVTPGFQAIVASGGIVNTGMTKDQTVLGNKSGTVRYESKTTPTTNYAQYTGDYTSCVATWGPYTLTRAHRIQSKIDAAVNEAATECLSNIAPPDALLAVTLAEAPKTIELVAESVLRLYRAIGAMKRGLKAQAIMQLLGSDKRVASIPKGQRLRTANDIFLRRWMETRYGWGPLMYDIDGAVHALAAKERAAATPRFTARGRATRSDWTVYSAQPNTAGGLTEPITMTHRVKHLYDVRAYAVYEVDPKFVSAHAWGITSLPLSMWELVPLSFVVDWLVNVGTWVQAMTPKVGVTTVASGYVVRSYLNGQREITAETSNPNWSSVGLIGWVDECTLYTIDRSPSLPSWTTPTIDLKLNPKRLLDALALLVGGTKGVGWRT